MAGALPVCVYAGFLIGILVHRFVGPRFGSLLALIGSVLAALVWWFYLAAPVAELLATVLPFLTLEPVASKQFGGFMLSIVIGMTGIAFSLPLGVLLALGRL